MSRVRTRMYMDAPRPIAFAHRGGAELWPENTLLAFREARKLGYVYIETDVHRTCDNELVLFHDFDLARTTNGTGVLAQKSLADLKTLDAGYFFSRDGVAFPFRDQGVAIPTVDEALEDAPEVRFTFEIKPHDPALVQRLWERIRAHNAQDRVLVACAHTPTVQRFRSVCDGKVATAAGSSEAAMFWAAAKARVSQYLPVSYEALQVPIRRSGVTMVDAPFIKAAHNRGLHVHVWTINDVPTMDILRALGVDGIMTDRLDLLPPV